MGKNYKKNKWLNYMSLEIAIPTYNRESLINDKTLKLLEKFNKKQITLYVEDLDQYEKYKLTCPNYNITITHTEGIVEKRNYIMSNTE